jgi:hypothetical protein
VHPVRLHRQIRPTIADTMFGGRIPVASMRASSTAHTAGGNRRLVERGCIKLL